MRINLFKENITYYIFGVMSDHLTKNEIDGKVEEIISNCPGLSSGLSTSDCVDSDIGVDIDKVGVNSGLRIEEKKPPNISSGLMLTEISKYLINQTFNSRKKEKIDPHKGNPGLYCKSCGDESLYYDNDYGAEVCQHCGVCNGFVCDCDKQWLQHNETIYYKKMAGAQRAISGLGFQIYMGRYNSVSKYGYNWGMSNYNHKDRMLKEMNTRINTQLIKVIPDKAILRKIYNTYIDAYAYGTFRGNGLLGACAVYMTVTNGISVDISDIAKVLNTSSVNVRKNYVRLIKLFDSVGTLEKNAVQRNSFIDEIFTRLKIDESHKKLAQDILASVENLKVRSNAKTISASVVLLMSNIAKLGLTRKDIAQVCSISVVTIYKCYSVLIENIHLILDCIDCENKDSIIEYLRKI